MTLINSIKKVRKATFPYFIDSLQQKKRNMTMKILRDMIRIRTIITQIPSIRSKSLSILLYPSSPNTLSIVALFSLFYTYVCWLRLESIWACIFFLKSLSSFILPSIKLKILTWSSKSIFFLSDVCSIEFRKSLSFVKSLLLLMLWCPLPMKLIFAKAS